MARIISYSRKFQQTHPRAGESTYFIEKLYKSWFLNNQWEFSTGLYLPTEVKPYFDIEVYNNCLPKHHTIRNGHRFKVGDMFSPRIWSGKPYYSKTVTLNQDIEVKKVWDFAVNKTDYLLDGKELSLSELEVVAQNDGLSVEDFEAWFSGVKEFDGQIICWSDEVNY